MDPEIVATALLFAAGVAGGMWLGAAVVTVRLARRIAELEARTMRLIDADCDIGRRIGAVETRQARVQRDIVALDLRTAARGDRGRR